MPTYRIEIEYDGHAFCGWQRQDILPPTALHHHTGAEQRPSVQGALEQAIHRFCGERVNLCGAGRTDSGVHALAMTASFQLHAPQAPNTIRNAINAHLKLGLGSQSAAVLTAEEVASDFSARFSCLQRHYLYRVLCRPAPVSLAAGRVWALKTDRLDLTAMRMAATDFVGHHDFSAFRTSICQAKSALKSLTTAEILRLDDEYHFKFSAKSFLHRQVRIMTGTLVEIGLKKRPIDSVSHALSTGQRTDSGKTAPPDGLYFVRADYI